MLNLKIGDKKMNTIKNILLAICSCGMALGAACERLDLMLAFGPICAVYVFASSRKKLNSMNEEQK